MREPDLPPVDLVSLVKERNKQCPNFRPQNDCDSRKSSRWQTDIVDITNEPAISAFTENAASEFMHGLSQIPMQPKKRLKSHRDALGRLLGTWLATKPRLRKKKESVNDTNLTAENFARFLADFSKKLSNTNGFLCWNICLKMGATRMRLLLNLGWRRHIRDINDIADKVIASLPTQVADYRSGKTALLQFFVGQVMKETKSAADPSEVSKRLLTNCDEWRSACSVFSTLIFHRGETRSSAFWHKP